MSPPWKRFARDWFSDECLQGNDGYYGAAAHQKAIERRVRQRKLIRYPLLRNQVVARVQDRLVARANSAGSIKIGNRSLHKGMMSREVV